MLHLSQWRWRRWRSCSLFPDGGGEDCLVQCLFLGEVWLSSMKGERDKREREREEIGERKRK
jgi:hypothetical protein